MDPALLALARKYRTLAEVRREKLRTGQHTSRETMRALAREFPGALRELDTLPLAELDRRAAALEAAARHPADARPWMGWMARFHELLRAALTVKSGRPAELPDELRAQVARPPGGRLIALVVQQIGRESGAATDAIAQALLPRRPSAAEVDEERAKNC
jgi:hypothetical protein